MNLDLELHTGKPGKAAVILIHGLGMNKYFWTDPEKCYALGGLAPVTVFLSGAPEIKGRRRIATGKFDHSLSGLGRFLVDKGFSVALWSQRRPVGPASAALEELDMVMKEVGKIWPKKPVFLAGHSRGGLIARMFTLKKTGTEVEGLITLCSPHAGTTMAGFARYLRSVVPVLEKMIPKNSRGAMTTALQRLAKFLQSHAMQELMPGSNLLRLIGSLSCRSEQADFKYTLRKLSFGGTDPSLFSLYLRIRPENKWKIVSFPSFPLKALPANSLPDELVAGKGDSLVSAGSSVLPGGTHYDFPLNHVRVPFDPSVQKIILEFMKE